MIIRNIAKFAMWLYSAVLYRVEVVGFDKYQKGPKLICSNHCNAMDPLMIGTRIPEYVRFIAKEELFKGIGKWFFTTMGGLPVARDGKGSDIRALKTSLTILRNKDPLLLFPEGGRNRTNKPGEAKAGIAMMAIKAQVPIQPISIEYTRKIFGKVKITFGDMIYLDEYYDKKLRSPDYQEIAQDVVNKIYGMMES